MATNFWNADLEVAVHGDELVIRADHLPAIEEQDVDVEDGEMTIRGSAAGQEHCLHLPLPHGLGVDGVETRRARGGIEVHMHLPA
jgi:hypothetical protein